jgi:hypothetical protein
MSDRLTVWTYRRFNVWTFVHTIGYTFHQPTSERICIGRADAESKGGNHIKIVQSYAVAIVVVVTIEDISFPQYAQFEDGFDASRYLGRHYSEQAGYLPCGHPYGMAIIG